ncbi:MAG: uroporphyrinogen decarboxylase [Flavobacteriales bacterium]|nr:uroporphyrinogen decarboxylase [Flavobacteriales bacterium]MCB9447618.1 uroporphyrinogen decarboxylase [Flavobacteriales bacterium]
MELKNDLILRAARGEKTERTPVWLMRQAGRVFPEYRRVREKAGSFKQLVENPELACEVTIQPVDILGVDAAILFSDILVIPEAMGLPYEVVEAKGPVFERFIKRPEDLDSLHIANPEEDLAYVVEEIRLVKSALAGRVPLIGFAGAPWTIFSYMVEGSGSKTFSTARKWLYTDAETSHRLLDMITRSTIAYLKAQVQAGANMVQVFDSWAGVLSPDQYHTFCIPYLKAICEAITDVPVIIFAKGAFFAMNELAQLPCEVLGLDWNMPIRETKAQIGNGKTVQGNLDPCLLYADKQVITKATHAMLETFGPQRHIANLGHGLYPDTNPDHVKHFVEVVQSYRHRE